MATYAIGDVQGCYDELRALLDRIRFDPASDRLWFAGDLVNRGPRSLEVLRFVKALGDGAVSVLGNHDLHLLATSQGVRHNPKDTIGEVLTASDREALLDWVRYQHLFVRDAALNFSMVHAGLPPQWRLDDAERLAGELETCLQGPGYAAFLADMYGNQPGRWEESLAGHARLRFITNAFTRTRFCRDDGSLDLEENGVPGQQPPGLHPWFAHPHRRSAGQRIVFGHWASLQMIAEEEQRHRVFHIDQGCVWGGALTALRLEDLQRFSVPSQQPTRF